MTFGEQVSEDGALRIMNNAIDMGINFFDTAEMYPIPARDKTFGVTERIIGKWLGAMGSSRRDSIILSSKISGPSRGMDWIRGGSDKLDSKDIKNSCDQSLKRMNTDYIDLYQIHWPARTTTTFGNVYYDRSKSKICDGRIIEDQLIALDSLVKSGKVRAIGLSNETPYGIHEFIKLAEQNNLTKISSIQNPYCLIGRNAEIGLDEMLFKLDIAFLAYSPLAFGLLTDKYDITTEGSLYAPPNVRLFLYESMRKQRWGKERAIKVAKIYNELAKDNGLSPVQLALSFCYQNGLVSSTIIGVTNLVQLEENIKVINYRLDQSLICKINEIRYLYGDAV